MIRLTAHVAPTDPGRKRHNTLVLSGLDLVIPLEVDLFDDPEPDDEIRIRSEDAGYEAQLKLGASEVEQEGDSPLFLFRFREVPIGTYDVSIRLGEEWLDVVRGLEVTPRGVYRDGREYGPTVDGADLGVPDEEADDPDDDEPEEEEWGCPG